MRKTRSRDQLHDSPINERPFQQEDQSLAPPEASVPPVEVAKPTSSIQKDTISRFYAEGDFIWMWGKKVPQRVCRIIEVAEIATSLDTAAVHYKLNYLAPGNIRRSILVPSQDLSSRQLLAWREFGLDVWEENLMDVLAYIREKEYEAKLGNCHEFLGLGEHQGCPIFKLGQIIGAPLDSTYTGPLDLGPQGNWEAWKNAVNQHILPSIPLQFALVLSFAGPIVAMLRDQLGQPVLMFHFAGDSSLGKTTAAIAVASVFGLPDTSRRGLIGTWMGTKKAVQAQLRNKYGFPMILDETSAADLSDFSRTIYSMASGEDLRRLNQDASQRKTAEFSGVLITTGENSMLANSNHNSGLRARVLEFQNVQWTQSAAQAESIKNAFRQNYGLAGPKYVEHILSMELAEILLTWNRWRARLLQQMVDTDGLSQRIASQLAVVLASAELANAALDLNLDLEGILGFVLSHEQNSVQERQPHENAYEYLHELLEQHHSHFVRPHVDPLPNIVWGKIHRQDGEMWVFFLRQPFKSAMEAGGFTNIEVILQRWRNLGWLACDDGRLTSKKSISSGSERVRCYCIKLRPSPPSERPARTRRPRPGVESPNRMDLNL